MAKAETIQKASFFRFLIEEQNLISPCHGKYFSVCWNEIINSFLVDKTITAIRLDKLVN